MRTICTQPVEVRHLLSTGEELKQRRESALIDHVQLFVHMFVYSNPKDFSSPPVTKTSCESSLRQLGIRCVHFLGLKAEMIL